jgi:2-C-methyl-D-erythritol 4-phosphate cytidylyltransferase
MKKYTIAIVLAAGQGKRMNADKPKQYLLIKEKPILYYTLKAFEESFVDEIVLVTGVGEEEYCQKNFVQEYNFKKVSGIIAGGKERYHSVYHALQFIQKNNTEDCIVFIHDGARPFVTDEILHRAYETAEGCGAAIVGVPVKDTIKIVGKDGTVETTPDRTALWAVQTPQVFLFEKIKAAYDEMIQLENQAKLQVKITDDAMVMENFGDISVKVTEGSYENIKITTPEDLTLAEQILNKE